MLEVKLEEVIRAVDVFLGKTTCPVCGREELLGLPFKDTCVECGFDFKDSFFDMDNTPKRNLVSFEGKVARKRISKKIVRNLLSIQDNKCAYCDLPLSNYHVEHIVSIYVGGTNNLDNLCISCPDCNQVAGSKYFSSFMAKRSFIIQEIKNKPIKG